MENYDNELDYLYKGMKPQGFDESTDGNFEDEVRRVHLKEAEERKNLLFDEDGDEDVEEEDDDSLDFDDDINAAIDNEDDEDVPLEVDTEEDVVDDVANDMETQGVSAPNMVSMSDLESVMKKLLGLGGDEQPPVSDTSPAKTENGTIEDGFSHPVALTGTPEDLDAVFGHVEGDRLSSDFAEVQDDLQVALNKIETEPTYAEYLLGDAALDEMGDQYSRRTDNFTDEGNYSEEDDEFARNADLSNLSEDEDVEILDTEGSTAEPLDSVSGGEQELGMDDEISGILDGVPQAEPIASGSRPTVGGAQSNVASAKTGGQPTTPVVTAAGIEQARATTMEPSTTTALPTPTTNTTVECCGMPIQIVLTGVMITQKEVQYVAESVKRSGTQLKKIVSKTPDELNFIVEKSGKNHIINYKDVDRNKNKYPFKIGNKQFQTLEEALISVKFDDHKAKAEKDNVRKFLNEDTFSRKTAHEVKESDIFSQFKGKTTYNEAWVVKSAGAIDLKTGLNETYANITKVSKDGNTLVQTKSGQYLLFRGNLKERSKEGTVKELIDMDSKTSFGLSKVVGVYENTVKGLGQIMFKVKKTTLPLLMWK